MKKIVIAGTSTYGIENQGDDALLSVFCRGMQEKLPDVEITLLARHPDKAFNETFGIKSIKNLEHELREDSIGRWFWGLNPGDPTDHLGEIMKAIKECDLLVIGGDPFIEITQGFLRGLGPYAALLVTLAKFLQKPIMLYALHISLPLQTELGKELTRFCVTNSNLVTVREEFSKQKLIDLGIGDENMHVLADGVFALDPIRDKEEGEKILKKEDVHITSPRVVGVGFRHMYWKWSSEDWEFYAAAMADACDDMIENMDVDLLFIPNCTYNLDHKYDDDRLAAKEVVERMKFKERAHQIRGKYSLYELLALFRCIDMIISNRRHSLVFGAIHGVPPVGVGVEWHMKPVMEELSLGDGFVKMEDFSSELLKKRIKQTWDDRENISKKISETIPGLREKALRYTELAARLIEGG